MAPLVLITGATGHIGSGVLIKALEKGYSVRAAVRSSASKDKALKVLSDKHPHLTERLTFIEVPDILVGNAYNEAVKDVEFVIHLASPLMNRVNGTNYKEAIIDPAVHGTTNILNASLSSPSIKRVVITSSVVANTDINDPACIRDAYTREPVPEYNDPNSAYAASKHAALLASEAFMAEQNPHFDLINVMPSFVLGRKEFADSAADVVNGSNIYALLVALQGVQPVSLAGSTVHLDDVATVHVNALELPDKKNRSFGVTGNFNPNDVFGILEKHFPKAVEEGIFMKPADQQQFHYIQWDATETEKTFNISFKGVEEQVVAVAGQYLELQGKA